jgi:ferredoxin
MIGKELPTDFFKRSGIKMEGELSLTAKLQFVLLLLFAGVLYFGKSSADFYESFFGKVDSWGKVFTSILSGEFWYKFFTFPEVLFSSLFSESVRIWSVTKYINAVVAYFSFVAFVLLGIYLLYKFIRDYTPGVKFNWQTFKYAYFISIAIFFAIIFFGGRYYGVEFLGKSQSFWYTGFYSLTILLFGLRRMHVKPTRYIKLQTWTLILIQALPLFILPEFVFPFLGKIGALGGENGFVFTQVFPKESYWRSYGFILAWPLNFSNLYNSNITTFWLVFSIVQTFVIIPYIVYRWGKGAYCGWICSCGALAETLGDEYRTLAPHGPKAKKWENFGQWALLAAFIITGLKLVSVLYNINIPIINEKVSYTADFLHKFYYIGIDVIFAGVLGVGVYFFMSGRVWCRFGCPLAAWMHIVSRFSRYRIFADKKKCISCNICTKVCHMGIDVMNYANKGIPMNDVECVRCSACVVNCPTNVLSFGSLPKADPDNKLYKEIEVKVNESDDWRSGLR